MVGGDEWLQPVHHTVVAIGITKRPPELFVLRLLLRPGMDTERGSRSAAAVQYSGCSMHRDALRRAVSQFDYWRHGPADAGLSAVARVARRAVLPAGADRHSIRIAADRAAGLGQPRPGPWLIPWVDTSSS